MRRRSDHRPEDDGREIPENIATYLQADLLDDWGFSEWVGPEPHGLGKRNTGTVKDVFTSDETVALLQRLDDEESDEPWLTVCSFLNPHDIAIFGVIALTQGLRYDTGNIPEIANAPTHDEDLSTKPACQQSYVDAWGKMFAPQPWIELQRKFYYQLQRTVDAELAKVLDALRASKAYENTIVVFSSDHGDMLGAHGGMHQKWHNAYEETTRVPFIVSGPLIPDGPRELDALTCHADLIPTLLGFAGIDQAEALERVSADHSEARPLIGRDLSPLILGTGAESPSDPILFVTDDEISEGSAKSGSPVQRFAMKLKMYSVIVQPNHIETVVAEVDVGGEPHFVKLSRYHDNQQFWTVPGERDERLRGRTTLTVTEPEPDEYELYDLTVDPYEQRNLTHPNHANDESRNLQTHMIGLLCDQLAAKRLKPAAGEVPGYRPPAVV